MSFLNAPNSAPGNASLNVKTTSGGGATGNPRNKISLKRGRSLMDWVRLGAQNADLSGTGVRPIPVTPAELARHNTETDCWMCIRGRVYNVTPYLEFHPGGVPELMRGAGQDATDLFDKVHKWVNFESMLAKCLVGPLVSDSSVRRKPNRIKESASLMAPPLLTAAGGKTVSLQVTTNTSASSSQANVPIVQTKPTPNPPRFEWFQTDQKVMLVFYTRWKQMKNDFVTINTVDSKRIHVILTLESHTYNAFISFDYEIEPGYDVTVSKLTGKVSMDIEKSAFETKFNRIEIDTNESTFIETAKFKPIYIPGTVHSVTPITHDTNLYRVDFESGTRFCVPLGYHTQLRETVLGMEISRNYTVIDESLTSRDQKQETGHSLYLMIKIYPDGALTSLIGRWQPGSRVELAIPSQGSFNVTTLDSVQNLALIAAGTGFTPMARLITHAQVNKLTMNKSLLFFNKSQKDILWKEQLNSLSDLRVEHVLSEPEADWTGNTGRVRRELLEKWLPGKDTSGLMICVCGPTQFTQLVLRIVKELGYDDENIHAFIG